MRIATLQVCEGMLIEFDTDLARQLMDEIDTMTPQIFAGIKDVDEKLSS